MNLSDVNQKIHRHKRPRRLGRGTGSGRGKTAGRGHKGQGQLAGWTAHPAFEGGQMPLARRIPKRGFNNRWAKLVLAINVSDLETLFEAGEEVTPEALKARGCAKSRYDELKVLGNGQLTKKLKVSAHRFSKSAADKIKAVGGQVVVIELGGGEEAPAAEAKPAAEKKSAGGRKKKEQS